MEESPIDAIFAQAAEMLRSVSYREDFFVQEIPAPQNLAPYAIAFAGNVRPRSHHDDSDHGTGRFILLFDPDSPEQWDGPWRIVSYVQSPISLEMGSDPFVPNAAWSWITDAFISHHAEVAHIAGTVTKIQSSGFGALEKDGHGAQLEIRFSWSPSGDVSAHLSAWAEIICMVAGLPPGSEQVKLIGERSA